MRIIHLFLFIIFFIGCKSVSENNTIKFQNVKDGFYVVTQNGNLLFFIQKKDSTVRINGDEPIFINNDTNTVIFPSYYKWIGDFYCSRVIKNVQSFTIEENKILTFEKLQFPCYKFTSLDKNEILNLICIPIKHHGIWNQKIKIEYINHPDLDSTIILSNKIKFNYFKKPININSEDIMLQIPEEINDEEVSDILRFLFLNMNIKPKLNGDGTYLYTFENHYLKISIVTFFELIQIDSNLYFPGIKQSEIQEAFIDYL